MSVCGTTLTSWDLATCEPVRSITLADPRVDAVACLAVCLSADASRAVTWDRYYGDSRLWVWSAVDGQLVQELDMPSGLVEGVQLNGDGTRAVFFGSDHALRLWDLTTGQAVASFVADSPLTAVGVSFDHSLILAGDESGQVHILALSMGEAPSIQR